jgi:hypothetical protein
MSCVCGKNGEIENTCKILVRKFGLSVHFEDQ